jgi:galactonate dehydratase
MSMLLQIRDHRLSGDRVQHLESPNRGGVFGPTDLDTIIIHYTAGANAQSAIDTLCDTERQVSAHLVVGADGAVSQLLPFNTVGWHAGKSTWQGRTSLNNYSVGIEVDNPGRLQKRNGRYISWFGTDYPEEDVLEAVHRNESELSYWHRFPATQLVVVEKLCLLLVGHYGIKHILGHEEIAPERKDDPGPAFPLDDLRHRLLPQPSAVPRRSPTSSGQRETMKITAIKPIMVSEGGKNYGFVKVETDAGFYGLGEMGLATRVRAVAEVLRSFSGDLLGQDPFRIEHLWQVMFRGGFFPGGPVQTTAVSAVDTALWDIKAKALGVPVFELLGGRVRDRVVCYPHVSYNGDLDALVANCKEKVDEGWKFVRWSVEDPAGTDLLEPTRAVQAGIAGVRAVREALGDEVEILLDVHTRLDPPASLQLCRGVEEFRPFFVEDPLRSENPASLRNLRQHTSVPLAVGEQFTGKWAFREVIEEELLDYCRLDVSLCGGLTEARKIAGWCETHYIALAPHNPLGPVNTAASLHLCLATALVAVQELPRVPGLVLADVFNTQLAFEDGYLTIPDVPGLGVEIDEAVAAEDRFEIGQDGVYHMRRDDGSYTNW